MTADLGPAATPQPTPEDHMTAALRLRTLDECRLGHTPAQHRHLAVIEGELRDARRDVAAYAADNQRAAAALAAAGLELARLRAELADAQELLAVYSDARELMDRGHARYDTRQTPGSPDDRAQDEPSPVRTARQQLDQALRDALPLAGGQVRGLLKALRRELARVDAKRAEQAEG